MSTTRRESRCFRLMVGLTFGLTFGLAATPWPVAAQTANPSSDEPIEEIIVTGTRIVRRDLISISPLTTIERSDIEFSGRLTIEEVLNRMPQIAPDFGRTSNNPGDGTARINLRGLGANRTLVLVNGRRLAPSGVGSAVDVNNLPQALIERVEIITGGASAVYGADAVAGVVNFITRDNLEGLNLEGRYGITEEGDGQTQEFHVAYGSEFAGGRGHVTVYGSVLERDALFAGERAFTSESLEDNLQGELQVRGSFRTPELVIFAPADLGNGPVFPIFDPDGNPRAFVDPDDRYDFAPVNYLQIPLERLSAGLMARWQFSERIEGYAEFNVTDNESKQSLAPIAAGGALTTNVDNPLLTPATQALLANNFSAGGNLATIPYGRRLSELGPRIIDNDREYTRGVIGLRGELGAGWTFDTWLGVTDATENQELLNDVSRTRFAQGLLVDPATGQCVDPSGGCVPVNPFGAGNISAAAAEFIRVNGVENTTERTQTVAGVFATGSLFEVWAGPVDVAIGLTWRRDEGEFAADEVLFTGDTLGFRGEGAVNGAEEVLEPYAEVVVPLVAGADWSDYLGLEAGVRFSDYKLAGGQWTHKFGVDWAPNESLRFRAMRQRTVRAPTIAELFEAQFEEFGFATSPTSPDPCSASQDPVGNGNADKCLLQGLTASQIGVFEALGSQPATFGGGGNTSLEPETADTLTVGFVLQPESALDWSLSIDYFDFEIEDTIGQIDALGICFDPLNSSNVFCGNIRRDANGNIVRVDEQTSNRGLVTANGIDTQLRARFELPAALSLTDQTATVAVNIVWTHLLEYNQQENPVSQVFECAGLFGTPCYDGEVFSGAQTFPENRVTTTANYASGPWSLYLTWQWIAGTDNARPLSLAFQSLPNPVQAIPDIGSKNYVDLGVGYRFGEHTDLRLTVNNALDTDPPQMAAAVIANNTDSSLYDVFGRSFFVSVATRFGN
ncbi:MAG: TonB-dependent receptor [Pseudomonadota bacterium]